MPGIAGSAARDFSPLRERAEPQAILPWGFDAQPRAGFTVAPGRAHYAFINVYGMTDVNDRRGPVAHLDRSRSHWLVTWTEAPGTPAERLAGRTINYANAVALLGRLPFDHFSSLGRMRAALPHLLPAPVATGRDSGD